MLCTQSCAGGRILSRNLIIAFLHVTSIISLDHCAASNLICSVLLCLHTPLCAREESAKCLFTCTPCVHSFVDQTLHTTGTTLCTRCYQTITLVTKDLARLTNLPVHDWFIVLHPGLVQFKNCTIEGEAIFLKYVCRLTCDAHFNCFAQAQIGKLRRKTML